MKNVFLIKKSNRNPKNFIYLFYKVEYNKKLHPALGALLFIYYFFGL